jgi:hypothetical protein
MKIFSQLMLGALCLFSPLLQGAFAASVDDACYHNVIRDALNNGKTMTNLGPWLDKTYNFSQQSQPLSDLPDMKNDTGLRSSAASVARACKFEHSGLNGVGENLFVGSETGLAAADWATKRIWTMHNAVNDWAYEARLMVFQNAGSTVGCNDGSSGSTCRSAIGHYTQMMWDDTTNVGCASQFCPSITQNGSTLFEGKQSTLIVCHYSPQGNYYNGTDYLAPYTIGGYSSSSAAPLSGCNDGVESAGGGENGSSPALIPILQLLLGV